ncbi:MAG: M23 family metallopeptidase [Acidimicrobiales bacterium]|nr:M23 family metallopeptidase [Acidimicrobiales bacterium]
MHRQPCVLVALVALIACFASTAAQAAPSNETSNGAVESVVFTSDASQNLVIDRATGLLPLISAAADLFPLTSLGIASAERRLRVVVDLLTQAGLRHRSAVSALAAANRLVGDNVRDATQLESSYGDVLAGISTTQRARLKRESHARRNHSAVVRQATSSDWVCPVGGRTKFRDSWWELRSGNRRHDGVDLVGHRNVPILAPVDGVVSHRWDTLGGWSFDLVATNGDFYFGTHMSGFGKSGEVRAGDIIGLMGDTGNAEGVHLHFEYHPGGRGNSVNAYPIVDAQCTNRVPMGTSLYD